jgi:hypothetical protein
VFITPANANLHGANSKLNGSSRIANRGGLRGSNSLALIVSSATIGAVVVRLVN